MSEKIELFWWECRLKNCDDPIGPKESSRSYAEMGRDRHIAVKHPRVIRMKRATFKIRKA